MPARVSLFDPAPRSTDMAVVSAVPRVTVSSPVPPVMVSVLETVALLVPLAKTSASLPAPRSTEPLVTAVPRVTVSSPVPPMRVSNVADGAGIAAGCQRELVEPGAEIDRHRGGQRGAEGDGVGAGAAGDGLGVGRPWRSWRRRRR